MLWFSRYACNGRGTSTFIHSNRTLNINYYSTDDAYHKNKKRVGEGRKRRKKERKNVSSGTQASYNSKARSY